jgi:hypothetical protein
LDARCAYPGPAPVGEGAPEPHVVSGPSAGGAVDGAELVADQDRRLPVPARPARPLWAIGLCWTTLRRRRARGAIGPTPAHWPNHPPHDPQKKYLRARKPRRILTAKGDGDEHHASHLLRTWPRSRLRSDPGLPTMRRVEGRRASAVNRRLGPVPPPQGRRGPRARSGPPPRLPHRRLRPGLHRAPVVGPTLNVRQVASALCCSQQWVRLLLARGRIAGAVRLETPRGAVWSIAPGPDGRPVVHPAERRRGRPRTAPTA